MRLRGSGLTTLIVAIVAVVVLAGCGAAAGGLSGGGSTSTLTAAAGGSSAAGTVVSIQNFAFTPQTLTVNVGDKVTWTNEDSAPHTVTAADNISTSATLTGLFDSGQVSSGGSFSFTFTKAGTYFYECTIHKAMPAMHGEIVVK